MAQAERDVERWWVCTSPLWQGGTKIIGPFESRDLALRVRTYVEAVPMGERPGREARRFDTFWVDREGEPAAVAGPGHVEDVPVSASEPNPLSMRTNPVVPVSAEPPHSATALSDDRPKRPIQRACDRCTQGVMDVDNPHLSGACECPCHRPIGPQSLPTDGRARTVEVSDRTGQRDPNLP